MPTRRTSLAATLDGLPLSGILTAKVRYGWKMRVPECTILVRADPRPGTPLYDKSVVLTMGAGAHNVVRFRGVFRRYSYALWPHAIGLEFRGYLARAEEYQNHERGTGGDGLLPQDFMGTATPTDQVAVRAALTKAGVIYTSGNIVGTGATWASRSLTNIKSFVWRSGTGTYGLAGPFAGAGQSALDFIEQWDRASAVYTSPTAPVGFYRTFESVNGVYRALIGGRPRSTPALTFSEGIDLEADSSSTREFPVANAALVTGADFGEGSGPVRNYDSLGNFLGQSSNPYQLASRSVVYGFEAPMIEWGTEADGGVGMNCERVGNALLADLNRETVNIRFRTPRDELINPGMTILVQGPGGAPDRLGIGEPLWVDEVTTFIDEDGGFHQEVSATGGGLPDGYTPPPPW